jgi:YD repeat-containing protein
VATISYPDGLVVNYAPDALGRPTQAGSFAGNVSYFPDGDIEHFTFGNGADYLVQKNTRQLLSNFSYANGATLNLSEDFVYDPNGNITNINDLAGGPRTKSFGYDALNRLTSAQAAGLWGTETYSYDPLNNIRSRVSDGQTYSYNYDATNRLASITNGSSTAFSFGYDNRGNVTAKNTTSLVFDQKNQLTQIPGLDSYAYDASGRRVLKSPVSGNPTYYFYTQDGQLLYQFEANSTKSTDYIFLGKKLIARNEGFATTVTGNVDGVNIDGSGNATLSGWACSTGIPTSITVEVFAGGPSGGGGTRVATATANQASEPAVATICQTSGTTYRFSIPLTTAIRSQYAGTLIYMYGDSPVGNGNLVLNGSGSFQVPAAPTAPAAPATATATVAGDLSSLTVTWSSASTATSYVLQQKQNSNPWNQILNSNVTSYTLSNPVDASYSYQVQACNANGCSAFTASNTVSVAHLPATPASISAPGSSTGAIGISWAAATYATSYTLEQSLNGGAYAAIYSGAATSNSFSVGATGSYTYRVKACNANGCSGYVTSGAVAVTIPPTSAPGISVPGSSNTGSYTVSWNGVAGATTYVLQEQVNGGGWTTVQNANVGSWAASGKGNGAYGYQVQGCDVGGCGPFSIVASVVVSLGPLAPTNVTMTTHSNGKITFTTVQWDAVAGATLYQAENEQTGAITYSGTTAEFTLASASVPSFPVPYLASVRACNAVGCSQWVHVPNS